MISNYRNISAPPGGFGNHIRWLCLLDDCFDFSKVTDNFGHMTQEEFDRTITQLQQCTTIQDKIDFIFTSIYPETRSWQNWLTTEWKFRDAFNNLIHFGHEVPSCNEPADALSTFIKISPDLCLRNYLKVNCQLNSGTIAEFKYGVTKHNDDFIAYHKINGSNTVIINGDNLFQEELPTDTYFNIVRALELGTTHYNEAKLVHKRWYNLVLKAEKEIVKDITNFYTH